MFKNLMIVTGILLLCALSYCLGYTRAEVKTVIQKIARLLFWLSLILMMMPLLSCSITGNSDAGCIEWPKGGPKVGGVYQKLAGNDREVMKEYFNRLYKVSRQPAFCKTKGIK